MLRTAAILFCVAVSAYAGNANALDSRTFIEGMRALQGPLGELYLRHTPEGRNLRTALYPKSQNRDFESGLVSGNDVVTRLEDPELVGLKETVYVGLTKIQEEINNPESPMNVARGTGADGLQLVKYQIARFLNLKTTTSFSLRPPFITRTTEFQTEHGAVSRETISLVSEFNQIEARVRELAPREGQTVSLAEMPTIAEKLSTEAHGLLEIYSLANLSDQLFRAVQMRERIRQISLQIHSHRKVWSEFLNGQLRRHVPDSAWTTLLGDGDPNGLRNIQIFNMANRNLTTAEASISKIAGKLREAQASSGSKCEQSFGS